MKLIKINKCKDCDDKRQCDLIPKREGGIIKYENVIPGECPLENYIELCKYKCSCGHSFEMKIQKVKENDGFRLEHFVCDNCGKKYTIHNNILKVVRR